MSPVVCTCGCGQIAPLARSNDRRTGAIRGKPQRFIKNHDKHIADWASRFRIEDRGYKTPCHIWTGRINPRNGYGYLGSKTVHVLAYKATGKAVPPGWDLDHLCRVRCCKNTDHLEPVTRKENARRSPIMGRPRKKVAA